MKIESERLFLRSLSVQDLTSIIESEENPELKQAYSEMLRGCADEPEKMIWHTLWFIELKTQPSTVVGSLCFKGLDADGMVELGYGLKEGWCGKGYMTEAVKAITEWALAQKGVTRVEAEAAPENEASQKVLANAGFISTGKNGAEGLRFLYAGKIRT